MHSQKQSGSNAMKVLSKERAVAQPGRVHVWGACCRKFESCLPDRSEGANLTRDWHFFFLAGADKNAFYNLPTLTGRMLRP